MTISPVSTEQLVAELADREAIRDCFARYARGFDQGDEELVRSAFWPDAHHKGTVEGTPEDLIAASVPLLQSMDITLHQLGQSLIRIRGDQAVAETYFSAFHRLTENGYSRYMLMGGRYADRLEKRGGEWRLADRRVYFNWAHEETVDQEVVQKYGITTHRPMPDRAGELFADLEQLPCQ